MFSAVRRQLEAVVAELDPKVVAPADAVTLLADVERIERLATAAKALLAPRAAESGAWRREGHVTPEHWLAQRSGAEELNERTKN